MNPVLIEVEMPKNVTLLVKKKPDYNFCYNIYIKGHWFRSWCSFPVNGVTSPENAIKRFIESYYGHIVTTDKNKYPEEFL